MAGYSGTPLWKKLGYVDGTRSLVVNAPKGYVALLALPADCRVSWLPRLASGVGFVHVFVREAESLRKMLAELRRTITPDGTVWVSWPKKASGVPTDVTEDTIRAVALPLGLVDVKVCAVDETWSGLKLMIRKSQRGAG